ncbi:O-methylpimelyl-ACP methylesterase [Halobellus salinus]|uniref:O-methylpimelyl-ACP methylesterase n=1 Tax=Halobellus salinus TaxID=931585 RepID=A0A830EHI6_9EURY|nr:alpha/beta fold hydrolase [Halobellus salinus]GGJ05620.1 O-methylpimelyl-ACP methylesterase [Halobellus salinus]SMP23648.1 Pimeloyl-ACP methyl ester carboxylesterase [Halobellus salinus]
MPTVTNGAEIYYETVGTGETVVFVGDAGYGAWQWGWQHPAVAGPYEAIVTDLRGVGRSDRGATVDGVETLAADLTAVLADAGADAAHLVGAGLGGMVALQVALSTSRVESLTLVGTAARGHGLDLGPLWGDPGDPDTLERSVAAGLSDAFLDAHPDAVERMVGWRAEEDAPRPVFEAHAAAVARFDVSDRLYEVTQPTLVVHGGDDTVWPPERGAALAEDLPRGEFHEVANAGHLVHVEASRRVNDDLLGFLAGVSY